MRLNQKILLVFGTFMNQTVPIYYIRISDMFESKNSTRFRHIYKSDCSVYYFRISNMFESKNSTHFRNNYESDCFDVLFQNF